MSGRRWTGWLVSRPFWVLLIVGVMLAGAKFANDAARYKGAEKLYEISLQSTLRAAPEYRNEKDYREEWRSKRDLDAQREMALASWWIMILTFIGVLILAATLIEANKTALSASGALEATKRNAELELRAYVAVVSVEILETDTGHMPNIFVKATNFGQTPAYNLVHRQSYQFQPRNQPLMLALKKECVAKMDLAPSQPMTRGLLIPVAKWEAQKPLLEADLRDNVDASDLYVFGEISYDTAFETGFVTRYRFKLFVDDDGVVDGEVFHLCPEGNYST